MDLSSIQSFIQNFGFPILVAIWALWRLDKNWGKGENIQARLDSMEDAIDRIEVIVNKNTEIQSELLITIRILQGILVQNGNGDRVR
jgi:hypothetical protein